jgi:predicted nucleic acid-binding protein
VIVVADTSPLNYLVLIGHAEILHQLYGRVVMPAGEAARRGIATTGTLGVLNDAAGRDLIDLADALDRLDKTTFRASPALLRELLESERRRRKKPLGP